MASNHSRHHLLYPRSLWNKIEPLKYLRSWLVVELFNPDHENLHRIVGFVPPLPVNEAWNVWHKVKVLSGKSVGVRLWATIKAINEEAENAHDYYTKRALLLTAEALNAQLSLMKNFETP